MSRALFARIPSSLLGNSAFYFLESSLQTKAMGEAQQLQAPITGEKLANMEGNPMPPPDELVAMVASPPRYKWWLRIAIFTLFILAGQSIGTLLLRLYFDKGGKSQWMSTLVQMVGFPILIPFMFIISPSNKNPSPQNHLTSKPSMSSLLSLYIFLGVLFAINCSLITLGVSRLPVSTFSLILASQLAFNALFSYFLNAQKFTPLILNSLFLLTISSALLVFQSNDQQGSSNKISKGKYALGFLCTVSGAATGGLLLSVTQFGFRKIVKVTTLKAVFDLVIYQCFIASILIMIGLFASKEWKGLKGEMEGYKLGKASYVITLVGAAMSWQVFAMGLIGLVFEVSSLFSNVIGALGLPIVPIFAVVFFHDEMSGVKVIALLLAIWGFASYIYQEYLDDSKSKTEESIVNEEVSLTERV